MSQTFVAAAGSQTYFGGTGINTFDYSGAPGSVVFDLIHNYAQNGFGGTDNVYNIQVVIGSTHGTTFTGGSGNETFVVTGGNNTISGSLSTLIEIPTATPNARPFSMVNGPDGSIWFTEFNTDAIARLSFGSPSQGITLTEFPTPHNPNAPGNTGDIAFDASGNMWFTEIANNKIGVMSQTGVLLHEYDTSSIAPGSLTHRIVAGPDGNMWFAEAGTGNIGKITPAGVVTEYALATNSQPFDITVGPDGNIWYTGNVSNKIGKITPAGVITEYDIPGPFTFDPVTGHGNPVGIIAGPDGALWFTEDSRNMIGRITPDGQIVESEIPTAESGPQEIVVGPDGALWFTEQHANKIARITIDGHFTEYPINSTISANPFPFDLLFGPDGNIWFSELTGRAIGRMTTPTVLTVDYSGAPGGVSVNLATGTATNGFGGTDTLSNVYAVIGSSHADTIIGDAGANALDGGAGHDVLTGGAGSDHFVFGTAALIDANSAVFDEVTDYSLAAGDQVDLSGILSAAYNHGNGQPATALVRVVADGGGAFGKLQVDTDGNGDSAHWLTIARLDGIHVGNSVNVILDGSMPTGVSVQANHAIGMDFNGDGFSDVLWRNNSSGDTGFSDLHGGNAWHSLGGSSTAYTVAGTGDFNGDGFSDVLWRNSSSGDTGYTDIHGGNAWHGLGGSSTAYSIVGVGDFNGDGFSDILFRNAASGDIGYSDQHNANAWQGLGAASTAYSVVGTGDFNGDGFSDVLWRNNSSGDTGYSDIHGGNAWHGLGASSTAYNVVGIGDFNGDGFSDILWRNNSSGDTSYTDVHDINASRSLGASSTAYSVVGVGDYSGDGFDDILYRNAVSGDTGYSDLHANAWHGLGAASTDYLVVG